MKICSKARVVQGSLLLSAFARVCGKFCSETSHIAAAHGAGTSIFKEAKEKQVISYSKHTSWKKTEHFSDVEIQ
jgi:hypothetical protein